MARAKLTVVGCGTVVPEADRSCSAYLLETSGARILMDCGYGAVRALARVGADWAGITHVWISHFHADHIGDLPGLLFSLTWGLLPDRRRLPLEIWGPVGMRERLEAFAAATGPTILEPGFDVAVREVEPGARHSFAGDFELRTLATPHTAESLAVRLDGVGGGVTYSGDSGPDVALGEFAAGSDVFVCECALPDEHAIDLHLSPSSVAGFARTARPGTLLLTHVYPQFRAAADVPATVAAAGYDGRIEMASEGWSMHLD